MTRVPAIRAGWLSHAQNVAADSRNRRERGADCACAARPLAERVVVRPLGGTHTHERRIGPPFGRVRGFIVYVWTGKVRLLAKMSALESRRNMTGLI